MAARARDFGSVWILGALPRLGAVIARQQLPQHWVVRAAMDPARAQVWLQRALDNWHLAEAHDIGVIAIIALVLLSSCFYVWTIVKSVLPKSALKKD